jgi:hypothetical protein
VGEPEFGGVEGHCEKGRHGVLEFALRAKKRDWTRAVDKESSD